MEDKCKTKEQLLNELVATRQRVAELERSENDYKLAEEALREREEMFQLFMELSPIYVFFKDEQIRSMQLSKNYEIMLGRPLRELVGKTMGDLFPSELAQSMLKDDLRILNEGKPIEVEEEFNGRFYQTTKFPIIRQGKPPRLAGFTLDITEAKSAEKALREQEERFRTIFNAVSDAIFVQHLTSGAIVDVNQRMCDMYGYTRQEALQLRIGDLCGGEPPDTEEHALKWIRKAAGGEPQVFEWRTKDKAGRLFWVEVNMRSATIGGQDRLLVTLHDITEQKRAQAQILDQQRTLAMMKERELLARELHDGIGQLLAAAHLQVKSVGDLLARGDIDLAEPIVNRLADLTQQAKQSIREYLLGVKASSDSEQSLLTSLRQYINSYSHNFGIHVELAVPQELEEKRLDHAVEAQLLLVIQEALTNVKRHSGSSSARVIFALCDNEIRITVEDRGRGFDPEEIMKRRGFGLQSMRGRTESVGGLFRLNTVPGKGTQVIVQVPWRMDKP